MIHAAVAEARKRNWKMNLAVADSGGNVVAFRRMDGAMLAAIQIALHKARAAATFRRPTKIFEDGIKNSPRSVPFALSAGKRLSTNWCCGPEAPSYRKSVVVFLALEIVPRRRQLLTVALAFERTLTPVSVAYSRFTLGLFAARTSNTAPGAACARGPYAAGGRFCGSGLLRHAGGRR